MDISEVLAKDMAQRGYRLLRLLGKGGAGAVFEASQISTGQTVAIKLLRQDNEPDIQRRRRLIERFERETYLCAQLQHPHIVKLLDKGQTLTGDADDTQQLFAVFEFVPGETLKDFLFKNGALTALETGELMGQVLDALAAAHAQGIVHRDLKPQNIMVMHTGARMNVKVLDFGIAAFIPERQMPDYRNLTITQETMCSPSYSAPEQLRGEPPTLKTDLYAWGLLVLECLTGRPAIQGMTLAEIFHKQLSAVEVPLPAGLVGHPLADLLRRVLRKNPHERVERAAVLYKDFQQINLTNIVGDLHTHLRDDSDAPPVDEHSAALTQISTSGWYGMSDDRQQITVLCCTLVLRNLAEGDTDWDALEALQRDQLNLCIDTATRYGGHLAGSLGNSLMFYYGYPQVADTDGRRCARSALELVSQVRRRNALLTRQHACSLSIRLAIHTGIVRVRQTYLPTGITPNTGFQLVLRANPGEVLVSAQARKILEQFMEFEGEGECAIEGSDEPLRYSALLGEYSAEAASFLRIGSLGRALIGREQEFANLRQAWARAQSANGNAVLVQGEAGIGKSRLSYELGLLARQQNGLTKECRCLPEYQNSALHPILSMLKTHWQFHLGGEIQDEAAAHSAVARIEDELRQAGCVVDEVLPILCSWLALPIPAHCPISQFSPDRQKKMLLDTLQSLILQIGKQQPLLLVVEDMHWIDQTSLELLNKLIAVLEQHPVLLLMTARPSFAFPFEDGQVGLQKLERLSESEAEQLIGNIIGGKPVAPATLRRLCERTDGIPLFVEELTRMLQDTRLLVERQGVIHLDEKFEVTDIPVTLRDLLSARLSRLGPAKGSAQLAAAIGREFDYTLLAEVSLVDEATLQNDLEQMISSGLIYRQRRVQGDSYIFHHALLRDAAYDAMPKNVREEMHARIAHQLESRSDAEIERDLSQLAHHFAHATEFEKAVKYATRAARVSLERALPDDAISVAQMAQSWISKLPGADQRYAELGINQILTNAFMSKYGWADTRVKENAEYALRLVEGIDDPQVSVPILWALAFYHHVASNRKVVRNLTGQIFAMSNQAQDKGLQVACHAMHGVACWIDGEYQVAAESLHEVLAHYDANLHANHGYIFGLDSYSWALVGLAGVVWFTSTDDALAFEYAQKGVDYALELNHMPSLGIALMFQALVFQYANDVERAGKVTGELLALGQKYGLPAVEGYGAILYSWARSDLAAADQYYNALKSIGCRLGFTYYASLCAEIEARAGNFDEALRRIQACIALCDEIDEWYYRPELYLRQAKYRTRSTKPDRQLSQADLQQAIVLAEDIGMLRTAQTARRVLAELNERGEILVL